MFKEDSVVKCVVTIVHREVFEETREITQLQWLISTPTFELQTPRPLEDECVFFSYAIKR